jgi:hypothetical protein
VSEQPRSTSDPQRVAVVEYRDGLTEAVFAQRLLRAADANAAHVVADLGSSELPGWRVLVALHRAAAKLRARQGRLAVVVRSERLVRLLRLTMLSEGFSVFRNRDDALRTSAAPSSAVELEVPVDRSFDAVLRLVTAGVGARAGIAVDGIDTLQLDLQRILDQPSARRTTSMTMTSVDDELRVEVGPLARTEATPELDRVLSTLVHEVETRGTGHDTWITLRVPIRRLVAESR